jgi:predicted enzyme related to lactoylglutathione lyase
MPATQVTDTVTIALFADPAGNTTGLLKDSSAWSRRSSKA